jgi:hypothetical protein
MPLTINVGLARKASRDFKSRGCSINLTAELDSALLGTPQRLQEEVAGLFKHAEEALEHQQVRMSAVAVLTAASSVAPSNAQNGTTTSPKAPRPATRNQLRALRNVCERLGLDLDQICPSETGISTSQLDIRQASRLIDLLRARERRIHTEIADHNGVPLEARPR